MARDPLDKDWRLNGTDGIANGERLRMWWNEGFTQGLTSVQKSMVIEWWLALVSVQDNADSMAAASSS